MNTCLAPGRPDDNPGRSLPENREDNYLSQSVLFSRQFSPILYSKFYINWVKTFRTIKLKGQSSNTTPT